MRFLSRQQMHTDTQVQQSSGTPVAGRIAPTNKRKPLNHDPEAHACPLSHCRVPERGFKSIIQPCQKMDQCHDNKALPRYCSWLTVADPAMMHDDPLIAEAVIPAIVRHRDSLLASGRGANTSTCLGTLIMQQADSGERHLPDHDLFFMITICCSC